MEAVKGGTLYKDPKIERAVISHFKIYEVSDMELDSLKEGDDGGKELNYSIACFSSLIGITLSFATSSFRSENIKNAIIFFSAFLLFAGIGFFLSYRKSSKKTDKIYKKIKSRGYNISKLDK